MVRFTAVVVSAVLLGALTTGESGAASVASSDADGYAIGVGAEGRIPILEWAVSQELDELVKAIDPTEEELSAVARRQAVTNRPDAGAAIASSLGSDGFAGVWLDLDGTLNVGYVGELPRVSDLPAPQEIKYEFVSRDKTLVELEAEARTRNQVVDVPNGTTRPRPPGEVYLDVEPHEWHPQKNRIPGIEFGAQCDDTTVYSGGTWGANVHWVNDQYQDKYGWLVAAHSLTVSAAGCDPAEDGPISGNDVDVSQDGGDAWAPDCGGDQTCWNDQLYRGIRDLTADANGTMDAVVIRMPKGEAADNRVHLGPGPPYDWEAHETELNEVRGNLVWRMTLCVVTPQQGVWGVGDFVQCGLHDGRYGNNDNRFSLIDTPHGSCGGDSGAPIVDSTSRANGGPRAVGILSGSSGGCYEAGETIYYFWHVEILVDLNAEFSMFNGKLDVCTENADGYLDWDCD